MLVLFCWKYVAFNPQLSSVLFMNKFLSLRWQFVVKHLLSLLLSLLTIMIIIIIVVAVIFIIIVIIIINQLLEINKCCLLCSSDVYISLLPRSCLPRLCVTIRYFNH